MSVVRIAATPVSVVTPPRRYTAAELVDLARQAGWPATERLVRDWSDLGLLERGSRRGRGRGRGQEPRTWSEEQGSLWQTLLWLRHGRLRVGRVSTLCNLPVSVWLRGDDRTVGAEQAGRAMTTWLRDFGAPSRASRRRDAAVIVDGLRSGGATRRARRSLAGLVVELLDGTAVDPGALRRAVFDVMDPAGTGGAAAGGPAPSPDRVCRLLEALRPPRWGEAVDLSPAALELARGAYQAREAHIESARAIAAVRWWEWQTDEELARFETPPGGVWYHACLDLFVALKLASLAGAQPPRR